MRRNLTSIFKFILLCAITVLLTIFVYRALFFIQHRNGDGGKVVADALKSFHPRLGAFFGGTDKNTKHIQIDWHDYKFMETENARSGIGEHGVPAFLPNGLEEERKKLFAQNGFNALLSDKISLNRSVKDIRHKE